VTQPQFPNPFQPQAPQASTPQAPQASTPQAPQAFVLRADPQAFPPQAPFGAQQPVTAPGGVSPFGAPAPAIARAPRMIDMYEPRAGVGRLLLLVPLKQETITRQKMVNGVPTTVTSTRVTTDVIILDGPPIQYGGKPEDPRQPTPHTKSADIPAVFEEVWVENVALVNAMREALTARATGSGSWMILGKLHLGQAKDGNNAPWLIGRPDITASGERGQIHEPLPEWVDLANRFLASPAAVPILNKPRR
jgi:hypothetical protein